MSAIFSSTRQSTNARTVGRSSSQRRLKFKRPAREESDTVCCVAKITWTKMRSHTLMQEPLKSKLALMVGQTWKKTRARAPSSYKAVTKAGIFGSHKLESYSEAIGARVSTLAPPGAVRLLYGSYEVIVGVIYSLALQRSSGLTSWLEFSICRLVFAAVYGVRNCFSAGVS
jgi:hypothetical protein